MDFQLVRLKLEEWLKPELDRHNLFFVDIKFSAGKRIEVYIDSDEGVHISECASISRFLEAKLEECNLVPENYILEVSSPGMSNPLKVPRQYKRRLGKKLQVIKNDGSEIEGEVIQVDDEKIRLRKSIEKPKSKKGKATEALWDETEEYELSYKDIKKALIPFKF